MADAGSTSTRSNIDSNTSSLLILKLSVQCSPPATNLPLLHQILRQVGQKA